MAIFRFRYGSINIPDSVPPTRTLTINGTSYDLSADRSWTIAGGGSVTSVAMTVPTGLSISGSPITTSGTLALTFESGYSIPTTIKQTNWDDAYTFVTNFPSQTGNNGKYLTTNGSTLSWATISVSAITTLNTLTASSQTFAVGTSGTDFAINSATSTHTFNLPTASATNRGALSSSDWSTFNGKQSAITLTTTGSSGSSTFISNTLNIPTYTLTGLGGVPTSRTLTINGNTLDLSADRSWTITATATPGGSNKQVQYNNAGALGGASNVEIDGNELVFVDGTFPSAPLTSRTKVFTDAMGGRSMMAAMGSDGYHYDFQPALFGASTYLWLPSATTTVAIAWGSTYTARNSGTGAAQNSSPTMASTNAVTAMNRAQFTTGTTATGAAGIQTTNQVAWLGNAAGLGGFFFYARFALEATSGTYRIFIGLSANNATLAGEPSALASSLGISLDSTDTTFQFLMRSATTATKINTTVTPSTTTVYDFYMYSSPNSSLVSYELRNALTNAVLSTSLNQNTNIPANTTFFYKQAHIMSATGTTAKILSLNRMYLETYI